MFRSDCPCPKKDCKRHGYCDECRQYHGRKSQRPYCERPKRSFAGSIKKMLGIS